MVIAEGLEGKEKTEGIWGLISDGHRVSFGDDEHVLILIVLLVGQLCDDAKKKFIELYT